MQIYYKRLLNRIKQYELSSKSKEKMPIVKIELKSGKEMEILANIRDSAMDAVKTDRYKTECFY